MGPDLDLVPLGSIDPAVLDGVGARLARHGFDPRIVGAGAGSPALVAPGTSHLQALMVLPALKKHGGDHVLGLTDLELRDGARTGVFGMAEMGGRCAVFSTAPFRGGGLTVERSLDRLSAFILHELAHNMGMVHCRTKGCLMHATHEPAALRQLDLEFCGPCARTWKSRTRAAGARPPTPSQSRRRPSRPSASTESCRRTR